MKTLIIVLVMQAFFVGLLGLISTFVAAHDERVARLTAQARAAARRVARRGRAAATRPRKPLSRLAPRAA